MNYFKLLRLFRDLFLISLVIVFIFLIKKQVFTQNCVVVNKFAGEWSSCFEGFKFRNVSDDCNITVVENLTCCFDPFFDEKSEDWGLCVNGSQFRVLYNFCDDSKKEFRSCTSFEAKSFNLDIIPALNHKYVVISEKSYNLSNGNTELSFEFDNLGLIDYSVLRLETNDTSFYENNTGISFPSFYLNLVTSIYEDSGALDKFNIEKNKYLRFINESDLFTVLEYFPVGEGSLFLKEKVPLMSWYDSLPESKKSVISDSFRNASFINYYFMYYDTNFYVFLNYSTMWFDYNNKGNVLNLINVVNEKIFYNKEFMQTKVLNKTSKTGFNLLYGLV